MLPLSRITAKDGSRYAIKIDSEPLEHIRCTIDDGFHQGGEYSPTAVYRLIPGNQIGNYSEAFSSANLTVTNTAREMMKPTGESEASRVSA